MSNSVSPLQNKLGDKILIQFQYLLNLKRFFQIQNQILPPNFYTKNTKFTTSEFCIYFTPNSEEVFEEIRCGAETSIGITSSSVSNLSRFSGLSSNCSSGLALANRPRERFGLQTSTWDSGSEQLSTEFSSFSSSSEPDELSGDDGGNMSASIVAVCTDGLEEGAEVPAEMVGNVKKINIIVIVKIKKFYILQFCIILFSISVPESPS